jgi:hypothetical protein
MPALGPINCGGKRLVRAPAVHTLSRTGSAWLRAAPTSIRDDKLLIAITQNSLYLLYTLQNTLTIADSNALITTTAARPNRPISEALLNEKVGTAHGII